jgi:DMSO/TMAO reductase YedYZ molybdopterin-dependent catalytic subunit
VRISPPVERTRRSFVLRLFAVAGTAVLAGCDAASRSGWFPRILAVAERANRSVQRLAAPRRAMAEEFTVADLSPQFRSNGTAYPADPAYHALAARHFVDWRLKVDGLVERSLLLSLAELHAMPSRTQITRHDCVEGWSAIGQWKGVPLSAVLRRAIPRPEARYVIFYCADTMDEAGNGYYESIDFDDAFHPQTILAYELNGAALPVPNGAPLRVRIERQLGYKMAKFLMRIELVASLTHIRGGNGGYWEDQGYEWFAGI